MCMSIETFQVSVRVPNATLVDYGILFGAVHPSTTAVNERMRVAVKHTGAGFTVQYRILLTK